MSVNKHAPAPWTAVLLPRKESMGSTWEISSAGDEIQKWSGMIYVHGNTDPGVQAQGEANLKLILGAPRLLAAAKEAVAALGPMSLMALKKAIAQAEGVCCECDCHSNQH